MRIVWIIRKKATKQYYGSGNSQSHVVFILHWQKNFFFAEKAQKEILSAKNIERGMASEKISEYED